MEAAELAEDPMNKSEVRQYPIHTVRLGMVMGSRGDIGGLQVEFGDDDTYTRKKSPGTSIFPFICSAARD